MAAVEGFLEAVAQYQTRVVKDPNRIQHPFLAGFLYSARNAFEACTKYTPDDKLTSGGLVIAFPEANQRDLDRLLSKLSTAADAIIADECSELAASYGYRSQQTSVGTAWVARDDDHIVMVPDNRHCSSSGEETAPNPLDDDHQKVEPLEFGGRC